MIEHLWSYLVLFLEKPAMIAASLASILLSLIVLLYAKRSTLGVAKRIFLIYLHLTLLITPFALLAYTVGCEVPLYDCSAKTVIYAVPFIFLAIVALGSIAGFFAAPLLYARLLKARLLGGKWQKYAGRISKSFGLRSPSVYLLDTGKPLAFSVSSIKPRIYISVGMLECLSPKEIEAVVLHELGHIQHRSSWLKVSSSVARFLSPIARFADFASKEEEQADAFAVKVQGTDSHVLSAHEKVDGFLY